MLKTYLYNFSFIVMLQKFGFITWKITFRETLCFYLLCCEVVFVTYCCPEHYYFIITLYIHLCSVTIIIMFWHNHCTTYCSSPCCQIMVAKCPHLANLQLLCCYCVENNYIVPQQASKSARVIFCSSFKCSVWVLMCWLISMYLGVGSKY